MVNEKNFPSRIKTARAGALFASITERDREGKPRYVVVPGSEGKQYGVIVKRVRGNPPVMIVECFLHTAIGGKPCKGASVSVCKHQMSAALAITDEAGISVSFCLTEGHGKRVANLRSGKIVKLVSRTSGECVWMVVEIK